MDNRGKFPHVCIYANYIDPKLSAISHQAYQMRETARRLLIEAKVYPKIL